MKTKLTIKTYPVKVSANYVVFTRKLLNGFFVFFLNSNEKFKKENSFLNSILKIIAPFLKKDFGHQYLLGRLMPSLTLH